MNRDSKGEKVLSFVKAHACGNDFLVMDDDEARGEQAALARSLCQRNTGIGADGIEFLERRADGTLLLRLFNADGSEAELSGNGTRCVAAWLAFSEQREQMTFETHGGERKCRVISGNGNKFEIESEMGVPRVTPRVLHLPEVGDVEGVEVNVGNPHFVIFVDGEDFRSHGMSWEQLGGLICTSPQFPQGTNVEFAQVLSPQRIAIRIFERGVGPTTSSGTGTCASAAASIAMRGGERLLMVDAPGGSQTINWPSDDSAIRLTGSAEIICWDGKVAGL